LTNKLQKKLRNLNRKIELTAGVALTAAMLLAVATFVIPIQRSAFAKTDDLHVQFVSNVEMIKGHMAQAVANKEKNDLELAKAHASHPIAEHYSTLQSEVEEHDAQLNSQLKSSLDGLAGNVDTMTAANFKIETERINKLLDDAVLKVIPSSETKDAKFNAQVIIALLSQTEKEYEEAVHDGKIVAMVEYQDAQAFRTRANMILNQIAGSLSAHEVEIAADFFNNLESSMNNTEDISKIEAEIDGIKNEVREGAGLPAESDEGSNAVSTLQYIQNVRDLLKQVSVEYKKGNFTGAEQLATTAYLDNFEHVEIELVRYNATDLKEETEQMLRVELREMIKNHVTSEQVDNHISSINAKLDQAVTVVPEFPIGIAAVAMASVMAVVLLASRFRTARSFGKSTTL
jgi:hypothetical protein